MAVAMHENTDVFEYLDSLEGRVLFLHGCNAQGVMGAGVAKFVRQRWPEVYRPYRRLCEDADDKSLLVGHPQFIEVSPKLTVVNGITQEFYGRGSDRWASSEAIAGVLSDLTGYLVSLPDGFATFDHYVTVPVGCGLGGLKWSERVAEDEPSVEEVFADHPLAWEICRL